MGGPKRGSIVRFGTEGEGIAPNYEVEHPGGEKVAYRGQSHKQNMETAVYAPEHLSEPYSYSAVQSLLQNCGSQKR
jgi:hypothetical protein